MNLCGSLALAHDIDSRQNPSGFSSLKFRFWSCHQGSEAALFTLTRSVNRLLARRTCGIRTLRAIPFLELLPRAQRAHVRNAIHSQNSVEMVNFVLQQLG